MQYVGTNQEHPKKDFQFEQRFAPAWSLQLSKIKQRNGFVTTEVLTCYPTLVVGITLYFLNCSLHACNNKHLGIPLPITLFLFIIIFSDSHRKGLSKKIEFYSFYQDRYAQFSMRHNK